jgi:hypothetical protein
VLAAIATWTGRIAASISSWSSVDRGTTLLNPAPSGRTYRAARPPAAAGLAPRPPHDFIVEDRGPRLVESNYPLGVSLPFAALSALVHFALGGKDA